VERLGVLVIICAWSLFGEARELTSLSLSPSQRCFRPLSSCDDTEKLLIEVDDPLRDGVLP